MLSLMMPTTISSGTSPPLSITALAALPISVPEGGGGRSRNAFDTGGGGGGGLAWVHLNVTGGLRWQ